MTSLGGINGRDKYELSGIAADAVQFAIEHEQELSRIAQYFCSGSFSGAFHDIMHKGLQEFLDMCDMDDQLVETERVMQNIPPGRGGSI